MYCNIKININSKYAYIYNLFFIPNYILDNLEKIINGEDIDLGEYLPKIRLIPFTSLGKENGILLGLKADNIIINLEENDVSIDNVIVGIYNGVLSKNNKYKALIGLELLENEDGARNMANIIND